MDIEVDPFVHDEFRVVTEEGMTQVQEQEAIREQIENTIRWRRVINRAGIEVNTAKQNINSIKSISYSNKNIRPWNQMHIL